MVELFLLFMFFAVIVGIAANTRGRTGFGWFLLAVIISPLLAGLLLLALPRLSKERPYAGTGEVRLTEGHEFEAAATRTRQRRVIGLVVLAVVAVLYIVARLSPPV